MKMTSPEHVQHWSHKEPVTDGVASDREDRQQLCLKSMMLMFGMCLLSLVLSPDFLTKLSH